MKRTKRINKIHRTKAAKRTRKNKKMKKTRKNRKIKGAGCGCQQNNSLTQGGGGFLNPATYDAGSTMVPTQNVIPYNPYNLGAANIIDPTSPHLGIENTRNFPDMKGGRKKKNVQKGGFFLTDPLLGANNGNIVTSFGNSSGVADAYNLMNVQTQPDPRPWVQPVAQFYGDHNKPLV